MNLFTRTAAVLFAGVGLTLTMAPLAGAASIDAAATVAAPATVQPPVSYGDPAPQGEGYEHWRHEHWRDGYWSDNHCDGEYYYSSGVWTNHCADLPAATRTGA
jgi:hypothetical protein